MDTAVFDEIEQQFRTDGAPAAIDRLCKVLQEKKDYGNLFYALLMKKRHALGVSPIPTSSSRNLPESVHADYEEAIRSAARTVGQLYLNDGNVPAAWPYFNMIGEIGPVTEALQNYTPRDDEDLEPIIGIAYHQGANPRKGFDWILERYGICSAITNLGGHTSPFDPEVREYCIKRAVRALYEELVARLRAEITRVEGKPPDAKSVREMMAGRFYLFGEDLSFVDASHLNAVIQLSLNLGPSEELDLARELCAYGEKLGPMFRYRSEPPFEEQYKDFAVYLSILAGEDVEAGLEHFRTKVASYDTYEVGTFPAEVFINLLLRVQREQEALEVAAKYLVNVDDRQLTCPGVIELCERTGNFAMLAKLAREHGNLVHYLAGLIAEKG